MKIAVVDTNVVLVANGRHPDVSLHCKAECAIRLQDVMKSGRLALDDGFRILNEYLNKTSPKTGNQPGDAFVKWALQNSKNPRHVDLVRLDANVDRGFESFPPDDALANFDPPDRKFVAVACAHPDKPPILQATDSKWLDWEAALKRQGIMIEFICRDDIERFHKSKFGE